MSSGHIRRLPYCCATFLPRWIKDPRGNTKPPISFISPEFQERQFRAGRVVGGVKLPPKSISPGFPRPRREIAQLRPDEQRSRAAVPTRARGSNVKNRPNALIDNTIFHCCQRGRSSIVRPRTRIVGLLAHPATGPIVRRVLPTAYMVNNAPKLRRSRTSVLRGAWR